MASFELTLLIGKRKGRWLNWLYTLNFYECRANSIQISDGVYCMQVSGLEPHVSYALRVKALSPDGRFGNFSEAVYVSRVDQGIENVLQHLLFDC